MTPAGPPPSRRRGAAGWLSGISSVALGAMGLGAVLCLWFPAILTTPQLREIYDMTVIRAVIKLGLLMDKNFAVHLPLIDLAFGTFHLPRGRWPERYGLADALVPEGYLAQLTFPFRRPAASRAIPP